MPGLLSRWAPQPMQQFEFQNGPSNYPSSRLGPMQFYGSYGQAPQQSAPQIPMPAQAGAAPPAVPAEQNRHSSQNFNSALFGILPASFFGNKGGSPLAGMGIAGNLMDRIF